MSVVTIVFENVEIKTQLHKFFVYLTFNKQSFKV